MVKQATWYGDEVQFQRRIHHRFWGRGGVPASARTAAATANRRRAAALESAAGHRSLRSFHGGIRLQL